MKYDAISEKLNDVWLNGFQEEVYGSCQEEGFTAALIITDDIIGIISEDDQGFVSYVAHETEQQARNQWERTVAEWEIHFKSREESEG